MQSNPNRAIPNDPNRAGITQIASKMRFRSHAKQPKPSRGGPREAKSSPGGPRPQGAEIEPRRPQGAEIEPRRPQRAEMQPRSPQGAETKPRRPQGAEIEHRRPQGAEIEPRRPQEAEIDPRRYQKRIGIPSHPRNCRQKSMKINPEIKPRGPKPSANIEIAYKMSFRSYPGPPKLSGST